MKVIFVCTGNTCRSPMAKVFADVIFKNAGLDIETESRGIYASEGQPASDYAKLAVRNYGLSLDDHLSKHLRALLRERTEIFQILLVRVLRYILNVQRKL